MYIVYLSTMWDTHCSVEHANNKIMPVVSSIVFIINDYYHTACSPREKYMYKIPVNIINIIIIIIHLTPTTVKSHYTLQGSFWLYMGSANGRRRYNVKSPLIGWAHTHNDPCSGQESWYDTECTDYRADYPLDNCWLFLTHCGLVTLYGVIELGQYWFQWWLGALWHHSITWTNVD